MNWTPKPLSLLQPLALDSGDLLDTLTLRPFTVEEHRAAVAKAGKDEDAQFEQLAVQTTGLSQQDIENLSRPDFVSLSAWIYEYISKPADHFRGSVSPDLDDVELLLPIKSQGAELARVSLKLPAVKAVKVMQAHKTPQERTDFITSHCTGLTPAELLRLSLPDWVQLQVRLNDFLNKPAAFFQKTTSK